MIQSSAALASWNKLTISAAVYETATDQLKLPFIQT